MIIDCYHSGQKMKVRKVVFITISRDGVADSTLGYPDYDTAFDVRYMVMPTLILYHMKKRTPLNADNASTIYIYVHR